MRTNIKKRLQIIEAEMNIGGPVSIYPTVDQFKAHFAGEMPNVDYRALHTPAELARRDAIAAQVAETLRDFDDELEG